MAERGDGGQDAPRSALEGGISKGDRVSRGGRGDLCRRDTRRARETRVSPLRFVIVERGPAGLHPCGSRVLVALEKVYGAIAGEAREKWWERVGCVGSGRCRPQGLTCGRGKRWFSGVKMGAMGWEGEGQAAEKG